MAGIDFRPGRTFSRRTMVYQPLLQRISLSLSVPRRVYLYPLCVHALNFRLPDFFIFVQSSYPRPSARSVHRPPSPFSSFPPLFVLFSLFLSLSLLRSMQVPFESGVSLSFLPTVYIYIYIYCISIFRGEKQMTNHHRREFHKEKVGIRGCF